MDEYGLTPDELIAKDFRVIQSSRRGFVPHGKRDWIAAIKRVHKRDGNITAKHLQQKYPYLYHQGVWIFGDWDTALRAAGFNPKSMRIRRLWDEGAVIKEIRALRARKLPLYARYIMKNHGELFARSRRQFHSWTDALIAAGVLEVSFANKLHTSPSIILRALRDALEAKANIPRMLGIQAVFYFGSLHKAFTTLRKDQRLLRGWSKTKIIRVLARMHRAKNGLSHADVRRTSPALVSAAEKYFGSWGKALYAAGIDPNLYFVHHRWRKAA
jgi:hypothetical protein